MVTIIPAPVPPVSLNIGRDTSSLSGTIVQVPISAGTLDNVASIIGSFRLRDNISASIIGIVDINIPGANSSNFTIQPNEISIQWTNAVSPGISFSEGEPLFVVNVQLDGPEGACTSFDAQSGVIVSTFFENEIEQAPLSINVADLCIARRISIRGDIQRDINESTGLVQVSVESSLGTSIEQGIGEFVADSLPSGASFIITPSKEDEVTKGVTTIDLVRILMHILLENPLPTPFKIIAADADNSRSVNTLDLVLSLIHI